LVAIAGWYFFNQPSSTPTPDPSPTSTAVTNAPGTTPPNCTTEVTPPIAAGPFYKEGSPERNSLLEDDTIGEQLTITGTVFDTNCQPVPGAWLDFWQTDTNGNYDNIGFKLRGHQFTDNAGQYTLTTIVPASYEPRPSHIHVKVSTPTGPVLTTQLYFPDQDENLTDPIFNAAQVVAIRQNSDGLAGTFDFVVP